MKFETIDTQTQYEGKVFSIRQDRVRLPNGREARLDIVIHTGAVTLIPLDEQGRIWFVRQYRHAAGEMLLELPAGTLEPDEEPYACALREVREETGMSAEKLELLGDFYLAPGYSTEHMYVYLATGLQADPLEQDEDEFLSVEKIPLEQAFQMAETGELKDAKSIAALMLAGRIRPALR
jgi:ADP-ribose pyrophosphatase